MKKMILFVVISVNGFVDPLPKNDVLKQNCEIGEACCQNKFIGYKVCKINSKLIWSFANVMEVMESLSFRNTEVSKRRVNGEIEKEPFEYFTALMGSNQLNHQNQDISLFQLTMMNLLP